LTAPRSYLQQFRDATTEYVWFYDVMADGYSLDDKRMPLLDGDKLGSEPNVELSDDEFEKNNLPDVLLCWAERDGDERERPRTDQSFCVSKADIVAAGYDLSINRYKKTTHEEVKHRSPDEIISELLRSEEEIRAGLEELKALDW
jgi:type I restriction enzyme M protein